MSSDIFFLVASFVRKSLRIEMVLILSDLKTASPFLKNNPTNDRFMTWLCETFEYVWNNGGIHGRELTVTHGGTQENGHGRELTRLGEGK